MDVSNVASAQLDRGHVDISSIDRCSITSPRRRAWSRSPSTMGWTDVATIAGWQIGSTLEWRIIDGMRR